MLVALTLGLAIVVAVIALFMGVFLVMEPDKEMTSRLLSLTTSEGEAPEPDESQGKIGGKLNKPVGKAMNRLGLSGNIAHKLAQANMAITPSEYYIITAGLMLGALLLGWVLTRIFAVGMAAALVAYMIPGSRLKSAHSKRQQNFTHQLPDLIMMLVSSLRAGYGLVHAIYIVVSEMPSPSSEEFERVVQEIALGFSLRQALAHMVERIESDDLGLMVTAINIQHEVGGNLSEILETISNTIRERVRIKGEIQVMTTQQRYTGYALVGMPFILAVIISVINPGYMSEMFQPGWPMFIPIAAPIMIFMGFILMRKMIRIDF